MEDFIKKDSDIAQKEVHSRIRKYIRVKGISIAVFCASIGVSKAFLTKASDFGISKIVRMKIEHPDISIEWLVLGRGSMFDSNLSHEEEYLDNKGQLNSALLEIIKNKDEQIHDLIGDKKYLKEMIQLLKNEEGEINIAG